MSEGGTPTTSGISSKVIGSTAGVGVAGALTILIDYIVTLTAHVDIPTSVQQAITVLLCAAGAFVGGYLPRHTE